MNSRYKLKECGECQDKALAPVDGDHFDMTEFPILSTYVSQEYLEGKLLTCLSCGKCFLYSKKSIDENILFGKYVLLSDIYKKRVSSFDKWTSPPKVDIFLSVG